MKFQVTKHIQDSSWRANEHIATKAFMDELQSVCEKHGLFISPTYEGSISFHDQMQVIPFDDSCKKFLESSSVYTIPSIFE